LFSTVFFVVACAGFSKCAGDFAGLDNISVLPTSIFIFDKFVDGTQPEVAGEIAGTF
jgi:hypothetical protein